MSEQPSESSNPNILIVTVITLVIVGAVLVTLYLQSRNVLANQRIAATTAAQAAADINATNEAAIESLNADATTAAEEAANTAATAQADFDAMSADATTAAEDAADAAATAEAAMDAMSADATTAAEESSDAAATAQADFDAMSADATTAAEEAADAAATAAAELDAMSADATTAAEEAADALATSEAEREAVVVEVTTVAESAAATVEANLAALDTAATEAAGELATAQAAAEAIAEEAAAAGALLSELQVESTQIAARATVGSQMANADAANAAALETQIADASGFATQSAEELAAAQATIVAQAADSSSQERSLATQQAVIAAQGTQIAQMALPPLEVDLAEVLADTAFPLETLVVAESASEVMLDLTGQDNAVDTFIFDDTYTDFVISADVMWGVGAAQDTCGFAFRRADNDNYYTIEIDQLRTARYYVRTAGTWVDGNPAAQSEAIRTGAGVTNNLVLVAQGDTFLFYVNGEEAAALIDDTHTGGLVALLAGTFADSGVTGCTFENASVYVPDTGAEPTEAPLAEVTEEAAPEVTEEAAPEATEEAAPEVTEEAAPEATEEAVPEATEEAVPEVTEEAAPEATEEAVPEVTEEAVPEVTEEAVPEVTEEAVPEATEAFQSAESGFYAGIPAARTEDGAFILGDPDAPITIVQFSDFACSFCQDYTETVEQFIDQHVRTGEARFEFRMFPAVDRDGITFRMAECGAGDDAVIFWDMHDALYELAATAESGDDLIGGFSEQFDLDQDDLVSCMATADQYITDQAVGQSTRVSGTPAIRLRTPAGDLSVIGNFTGGGVSLNVLSQIVASAQPE